MAFIRSSDGASNCADLPLFRWAESRHRRMAPPAYPANWLRRRFPSLSPARARVVAALCFGDDR